MVPARAAVKSSASPANVANGGSCAEFFAGIGLMRLGLERAGWRVAFANDIDEQKRAMYAGHFCDEAHFSLADIHTLPADAVPTVDLATASFPCTDLSLAGARRGLSGGQSSAFWGFVRVLREMGARRPPLVMLENVTGFLTSHGGDDFRQALLALNELGYAVDAFVINAAHFVPQSRPRLFVIGKQTADVQQPVVAENTLRPKALVDMMLMDPDIRWDVQPLPPLPPMTTTLADIVEDLPDDAPEWWNQQRAEYLYNQMSDRHREVADAMITAPRWSYGAVFRRVRKGRSMAELRTDGLAGCLRTPRGGSGRQILFKAGFGRYAVRLVTPRECARLMGADDYRITTSLNRALFGFGDAVCVPVVEWIARRYLNPALAEMTDANTTRRDAV